MYLGVCTDELRQDQVAAILITHIASADTKVDVVDGRANLIGEVMFNAHKYLCGQLIPGLSTIIGVSGLE